MVTKILIQLTLKLTLTMHLDRTRPITIQVLHQDNLMISKVQGLPRATKLNQPRRQSQSMTEKKMLRSMWTRSFGRNKVQRKLVNFSQSSSKTLVHKINKESSIKFCQCDHRLRKRLCQILMSKKKPHYRIHQFRIQERSSLLLTKRWLA